MLAFILLVLPAVAYAGCPNGCTCLPGGTLVKCGQSVDRIPEIDPDVKSLDLTDCRFSSPVLQRANLSGLANLESLNLRGCGISNIEYHTFVGKHTFKNSFHIRRSMGRQLAT